MNVKYLSLMSVFLAMAATSAGEGSFFDGGWRVSVGAAYNAPSKVKLNFSPVRFSSGFVAPTAPAGSLTKAQALEQARGKTTGTRTTYSEDGKIYYDTDSSYGQASEEGSWNVQAPYETWNQDDRTFTMANVPYVDVVNMGGGCGRLKLKGEDEAAQPGVTIELSRNLYHNEEWRFGVDLAFAFSYFFDTDLYKAERSAYRTDTYGVQSGTAQTTIESSSSVLDEELYLSDDGRYYGSNWRGPGTLFYAPVTTATDGSSSRSYGSAALYANGDYRDIEMMLALRPYYDLFDWLRLYGTIGAAVSWTQFNIDMTSTVDGWRRHYSCDYDQWDVYGVGGLGLMFRWRDFTLGFDFIARFFQDRMDFDDSYMRGSFTRSPWMFRGMIGYEF